MKRIYYDIRRRFSNLCFYIRNLLNLPDPVEFKYVDIVFENCNSIRIPPRLVNRLRILNIRKNIFTNFCQQYISTVGCDEFQITLKNEALNLKTRFETEFDSDPSSFERHLKVYKDVTHIEIKPNKGKRLYIGVPYKTKGMAWSPNLLQKNKFEKDSFTISSKV